MILLKLLGLWFLSCSFHTLVCVFAEKLSLITIPLLFGLIRALGRSSDGNKHLISLLYPSESVHKELSVPTEGEEEEDENTFTFRSILPRTISSHLIYSDPNSPVSPTRGIVPEIPTTKFRERSPTPLGVQDPGKPGQEGEVESSTHYFCKIASSFTSVKPWGFEIIPEKDHLVFTPNQLQILLSQVCLCAGKVYIEACCLLKLPSNSCLYCIINMD